MDTQTLGGNIQLAGFSQIDKASLEIVKKMVGRFTNKLSEKVNTIQSLQVTMKTIHNNQYEIHAKLQTNKPITATDTNRNLFVAVDQTLKKIESEL